MSDWRDPELLDLERSAVQETSVKGGAGARARTVVALLVVAFVGFLILRAIAEPRPEGDETSDGESAIDETSSTTTTRPPRRTTTTRAPQASAISDGQPVFDSDTGWDLLLGGESKLRLLNLDGGESFDFEIRGVPVALVGDYLLYFLPSSGSMRYAPVTDLGASEPIGVDFYGYWTQTLVMGDTETQVWLRSGSYDRPTWQLWDFAGPEPGVISEITAPLTLNFPSLHPTIMSAPSGGVFVGVEGAMERVAEGNLIAVTKQHIVVEQCETPFECPAVWLKRDDFSVDEDMISPPSSHPLSLWGLITSPDGTYGLTRDRFNGEGLLWNFKTGEAIYEGFIEQLAYSPDSRYAAGTSGTGRMQIIDLQTGEIKRFDSVLTSSFYQAIFVPKGSVPPPAG